MVKYRSGPNIGFWRQLKEGSDRFEATGQEPLILSGTPEVEQTDLLGSLTMDGGSTQFADGPLPRALKSGRWLVVEEFSQIPPEARSPRGYTSDRVLIDACRPYRWMEDFPQVNAFPPEVKEHYRKKWNF